jgi:hypothetical protein
MIPAKRTEFQLPKEIKGVFFELKILKHLAAAGISKNLGFTGSYVFQWIFTLLFQHKNLFQLLESKKGAAFPGKDVMYRFLNHSRFNWRRFLLLLSSDTVKRIQPLTSTKRVTAFVVDDSMFERNRSKSVELLARFKDHATGAYYKGYRMLTLGWSDGHTFLPLDFSLLSSIKSQIKGIAEDLDKRTLGFKRRLEALKSAPHHVPIMLERALNAGCEATYVLMDSWFTHAPLIEEICKLGLDVIGMVKNDNKRYLVGDQKVDLKKLYRLASPVVSTRKRTTVLRSIQTQLVPDIPVLVVFVRHRSKKNEWLAILSTDCTISEEEMIRIYGIRWDIEVFFKCAKSMLRLQKEFQGRSYDMMISHTTIVFTRYIVLAWQHRLSTDARSFGGMFHAMCDEVKELDWAIALTTLVELVEQIASKTGKRITTWIQTQLLQWISSLPSYIMAYLPISMCES